LARISNTFAVYKQKQAIPTAIPSGTKGILELLGAFIAAKNG
jgi:hypothetical protein